MVVPHNRRAFLVVAYTARNTAVGRDQFAELCWPDSAPLTASKNLRSVLSNLRKLLPDLLVIERDRLTIAPGARSDVDVLRFEDAAAVALDPRPRDTDERLAAVETAQAACTGTFLAGFERYTSGQLANWLDSERGALERTRLELLDRETILRRDSGDLPAARRAAHELVRCDPYRERSYERLVDVEVRSGNRTGVVDAVGAARRALVDDLGVSLGPQLSAIAAAHTGRRPTTPPRPAARTAMEALDRLPAEPLLFGRSELIDRVSAFHQHDRGVISLVGIGGIGKTSLATALAHRWQRRGEVVAFIELADIPQSQLLTTVATALGADADPTPTALAATIGDREAYVILDNAETHLDALRTLVSTLSEACPRLHIVLTTQVPLSISAEVVVPVGGLDVPPQAEPIVGDRPNTPSASSVRLFRHLARRHIDGLRAPAREHSEEAIAHICRWADGHPLAIELAAAQLAAIDVADLAAHLGSHDLSAMVGLRHDAPERHRSLAAAIEVSLDQMSGPALQLFQATAVFDGPIPRDALFSVVGDREPTRTLHLGLTELIDRGFIRRDSTAAGTWLLVPPVLRSVAAGLLGDDHAPLLGLRRRYDVDKLRIIAARGRGKESVELSAFLGRYEANLLDTIDVLVEDGDPEATELVLGLAPHWFDRGRFRHALSRLMACPAAGDDWVLSARDLWLAVNRAEIAGYQADPHLPQSIVAMVDRIRSDAPTTSYLTALAAGCHGLDLCGCPELASPLLAEGVRRADAAGEAWSAVQLRYAQAMIAHVAGEAAHAETLLHRTLTDAVALGDRKIELYSRMLMSLSGIGGPAGGDHATLTDLLTSAIELGDLRQVNWLLSGLATIALLDGDVVSMARYSLDGLGIAEQAGYFLGVRYAVMTGASAASLQGDQELAARCHALLEIDLDRVERSMPREYFDGYLAIVKEFDSQAAADPALAELRWPQQRPSLGEAVSEVRRYFQRIVADSF